MSRGIEGGAGSSEATIRETSTDDDRDPADLELRRLESRDRLGAIADGAGLHRVDVVAWRDLDDAEAGGSELHAHEILTRWADAGIDVRLWTSRVDGAARYINRSGYAVNRRAGRYAVFPPHRGRRSARQDRHRATVWSRSGTGCPFFSPLWSHVPEDRLLAPCPRRDVEHGPLPVAGPARATSSSTASRPPSTGAARSSPCPSPRRDDLVAAAALPSSAGHRGSPRDRQPVHSGPRDRSRTARRRRGPSGPGQAIRLVHRRHGGPEGAPAPT